jgi:diaminopimelate decarboxylase
MTALAPGVDGVVLEDGSIHEVPSAVAELVAGLPVTELPAYVHDLNALRRHTAHIRDALPRDVELLYAVKANPEPRVLPVT